MILIDRQLWEGQIRQRQHAARSRQPQQRNRRQHVGLTLLGRLARNVSRWTRIVAGARSRVRRYQSWSWSVCRPGVSPGRQSQRRGGSHASTELVDPDGHVLGIDMSETMVAEARQLPELGGQLVEPPQGDIYQLAWPDEGLDALHTERLFHHLEEPRCALAELVRVIRPGGHLVAAEPGFDTVFVDSPDRKLTRRALHLSTDWVRNGWMGRHLRTLLLDGGLVDVTCDAFATTLRTLHGESVVAGADSAAGGRGRPARPRGGRGGLAGAM